MLTQIYLSKGRPDIMVGHFIGEVKTVKDPSVYTKEIKEGIRIHQLIEEFTENHPDVEESRKRLNPKYSKYSDTILNFFYDHFLAANWNEYCEMSLEKFSMNTYRVLLEYQKVLPYKAKYILPRMIRGNWFSRFTSLSGVSQVVGQMDIKSTKLTYIVSALEDLIGDYKEFGKDFSRFFPKLIKYVQSVNKLQGTYELKAKNLVSVN